MNIFADNLLADFSQDNIKALNYILSLREDALETFHKASREVFLDEAEFAAYLSWLAVKGYI